MGPAKSGKKLYGKTIKNSYPDCFNEEIVVCDWPWKHSIDTGDERTIKTHGRPHTPTGHALLQRFLEDGVKQGMIKPSSSPWSAFLILIRKPDGSTRVCVDYRGLNVMTKKNAYPLRRIDDTYQLLSDSKCLLTLDLKSGFWQIQMEDMEKGKGAFTLFLAIFNRK